MPNSIISTVAGGGPGECSAGENSIGDGDGGSATEATLCDPSGVVMDSSGNLYIADTGDNRIRVVNPTSQIITTVAGTGGSGYSGDGGLAVNAELTVPSGVAVDVRGNIYIADGEIAASV